MKRIEEIMQGLASKEDIRDFVDGVRTSQQMLLSALASITERERDASQIEQLQHKISQTEEELLQKAQSTARLAKQFSVAQVAGIVAERMAVKCGDRLGSEAAIAFRNVSETLLELGKLREDAVQKSLEFSRSGGPLPLDAHERLMCYAAVLLKSVIQFDVIATLAAAIVPLALESAEKHPDGSGAEIIRSLVEQMDSEQFLVELAKRGRSFPACPPTGGFPTVSENCTGKDSTAV